MKSFTFSCKVKYKPKNGNKTLVMQRTTVALTQKEAEMQLEKKFTNDLRIDNFKIEFMYEN